MSTKDQITLAWVKEQKSLHIKAMNELKGKLAEHNAALEDLAATERVIMRAGATAALYDRSPPNPKTVPSPLMALIERAYGRKKRGLLGVIAQSAGLTTQQIIAEGTALGLTDLNMNNVSPQLSNYKSEGLLSLDGGLWRITDKGREFLSAQME